MSAISRIHFPVERLFCNLSLYLVANRPSFQDEQLFFLKIREAVRGGVSCVQLRDHRTSYPANLKVANRLKEMLSGVPLFINTLESIKVAQSVCAEGVYLEEGACHFEVRRILGERIVIGIPVKTMDEVIAASQTNTVDYLSVKVSPSKKTSPKDDAVWGIEGLRKVRLLSPHRIVVIGGCNLDSAEATYRELRADDGVAMSGGLMDENDPYLTAQKIQFIRRQHNER